MLVSKKTRVVHYGRPSNVEKEDCRSKDNVSSSSKSGDTERPKQSQSSSQSNGRPKPRPSQSDSTFNFQTEPNQDTATSLTAPLFRSNESDTGSDSEIQNGEIVVNPDPSIDVDTEDEGEMRPVLSGSRKKRSKRKAVSHSSDGDESAVEMSLQSQRFFKSSNTIEISSDEADEQHDLPTRKKSIVPEKEKITQRRKRLDEDGDFDVERIIRWRRHPRKKFVQYRVKWKNYQDWSNSWEPGKNFTFRNCIDEFWKTQKKMFGTKRPANTYKKDDDGMSDSELQLESSDTDEEIKGKDISLAKSEKQKSHSSSNEDKSQEDSNMDIRKDGNGAKRPVANLFQTPLHPTSEGQARSETSLDAFVVADDKNDDDEDYVDSLQDDYMPLPTSDSHASRSSTGEASLQLTSNSKPVISASRSNSAVTMSSTESRDGELREGNESHHHELQQKESASQSEGERLAYARTFAPSVLPVRRRAQNANVDVDESVGEEYPSQRKTRPASSNQVIDLAVTSPIPQAGSSIETIPKQSCKRKIIVLDGPDDPLHRLSRQPEERRRRRLSLSTSRSIVNNNINQIVSFTQPDSTREVDRRFDINLNSSRNRIGQQANDDWDIPDAHPILDQTKESVHQEADKAKGLTQSQSNGFESEWDISAMPETDTDMADTKSVSYGWGADEENGGKSTRNNSASQMTKTTPYHKSLPYKEKKSDCERLDEHRSGMNVNATPKTSSAYAAWGGNGIDNQAKTGGESGGWDDDDLADKGDAAGAGLSQSNSFDGHHHTNAPHNFPLRSMHPDRLSQLCSSDATLNASFQGVQINSPTSPATPSCWRRDGPLPSQKESLGVARTNGSIPKSDSASETGDSDCGRRRSSTEPNRINPEVLKIAKRWPWTNELNHVVRTHYNIVPKRKHDANVICDEARNALITYILHQKGGFRPEFDDYLRKKDKPPCVMWIRDPSQPLGDEERHCLTQSNFVFIRYQQNTDEIVPELKYIWRKEKPQLLMYSLGALVCKLIEWCQGRQREEERKTNNVINVFDAPGKTLCHPWQPFAIEVLIENHRMGDFLKQVLGLDNFLATEFEMLIRDYGTSVLESLDKCRTMWTNIAKCYPDQRPGGPEPLPDDIVRFTLELDRETHGTLMNMQHWLCEDFRSFNFAIAGCSMDASHIGTCYSRVDIPTIAALSDVD
ncbi:hypothetical protein L7F22_003156 [Adiantum nelumboides]|nr:hypothetical protein [Adiantum nelumboides]